MKELYTSPEVELLRLAAEERLAADIEFDEMVGNTGGGVSADPDIDIDVPLN